MTAAIVKASGWFTGAALLAIGCVPTEGSLPGTGILDSLGIREPVGEMLADEFLTTDQSAQVRVSCDTQLPLGDKEGDGGGGGAGSMAGTSVVTEVDD